MTDQDREPLFLSGGMRPGVSCAPVALPNAEDVLPGSVMLDVTGLRWRATSTAWVPVVIVTSLEHRALARRTHLIGGVSLAAFALIVAIGVVALVGHALIPTLAALPLFAVAVGFGFWWSRLHQRLVAQDVVPEPSAADDTPGRRAA
ncbi:hypothetical protein [Leifsonia poae]|uniref:hypothetical protein n=1 Tax=Leifsonia poae TaxID=110933 RepID=UPI001CBBFBB8|nr:hypothetical protein [Leifsonia poae]